MELSKEHLSDLCAYAKTAAVKAGNYIQKRSKESIAVMHKEGGDSLASQVVTEVDLKSQDIILDVLDTTFKLYDLALLTEESEDNNSRFVKDYFWCIDPLDGTLPFTEGKPGYAVSIALVSKQGESVVGVVYDPVTETLYSAYKGGAVLKNDQTFSIEQHTVLTFATDRSFISAVKFKTVVNELKIIAEEFGLQDSKTISHCGSVKNAINVLENAPACYFKYPKINLGGGSIWDFAATNCIFKELGLPVFTSYGDPINLNTEKTTFMNHCGVVYCSSEAVYNKLRISLNIEIA